MIIINLYYNIYSNNQVKKKFLKLNNSINLQLILFVYIYIIIEQQIRKNYDK